MKMCTAPKCDKPGRRGNSRFCSAHESRYQRYGDPHGGPRAPYGLSAEERFWHYVDKVSSPKGCWLWRTGGRASDGYVLYEIQNKPGDRRSMLVHRYAWLLRHGCEPTGTLDHTCYVRHCVNTDHLVEMTLEQNQQEGRERRSYERLAYEVLLRQVGGDESVLRAALLSAQIAQSGSKLVEPWGNISRTPRVSEGPARWTYNRELW